MGWNHHTACSALLAESRSTAAEVWLCVSALHFFWGAQLGKTNQSDKECLEWWWSRDASSWLILSFLLLNYRLQEYLEWLLANHCLSFHRCCNLPPTSDVELLLENGVASQDSRVPNDIPTQQPCPWFLYGQWTMHHKTYVHLFGSVYLCYGVTSFLQPSPWLTLQSATTVIMWVVQQKSQQKNAICSQVYLWWVHWGRQFLSFLFSHNL